MCDAEARQLLLHVEPVGEHRDLLRQPLLVDRHAVGELPHRLAQPVALLDQRSGARAAIRASAASMIASRSRDTSASRAPFLAAHLRQRVDRALDDRQRARPAVAGSSSLACADDDVGHPQHRARRRASPSRP